MKAPASKSGYGEKKRHAGRGVLIKSGRLFRSIRILKKSGSRRVVGSTVPYAKVHNEGLRVQGTARVRSHTRRPRRRASHTVRAHTRSVNFKMPKRPFLTDSKRFRTGAKREVVRLLNKAMR